MRGTVAGRGFPRTAVFTFARDGKTIAQTTSQ